jgi:tRNA threonylcarbamoyl adenosine modification protein YjeE
MILERLTASERETEAFAAEIARQVTAPLVLLLDGDLGAGKTTFARGFVGALAGGDGALVQSPTFALARTYATTPRVHHLDLYRLDVNVARALEELGVIEMLRDDDAFALVEWPRDLALPGRVGRATFSEVGHRRRLRVVLPIT